MRRLVTAIIAMALPAGVGDLAAQTGVIRGRVVRADGPGGLAGVEVLLTPSGFTTRTDTSGHFVFMALEPGPVELTARRAGFVTAMVELRVAALAATELEIRLEPVAAVLDPVRTSATRLESRRMAEAPGTVSVTDSSAIQRGATVGLHETLRTVPGVQAVSRYGTDDVTLGIRGSAARARQAVRGIMVLLDGVPITEPDGVARLDLIELAAARQIEVLRGPASALHGGSPGGVVNVVSRTGSDSRGITVRGQGGPFGFRKYDGRAGGVFSGGRSSAIAAASHTSTDGYRAHGDAETRRGQVGLEFVAGTGTRLMFHATGSRLDSRLPGSLSQSELDADPQAASPPAAAFGFGRGDRRYRVGGRIQQALGASAVGAYFFYGGRTLFFPIPSQIVDLDLERVQLGGRLHQARIPVLGVQATAGLDYDRIGGADRRWVNEAGAPGTLRDDGRTEGEGLGAYAQVEWEAGAAFTATLGLRYDLVTYRFQSKTLGGLPRQKTAFDQASPRLAAVWRPDIGTSVYVSIGRGFEVPAFGELSPSPGSPIRTLHPRSLWNYEVGARRWAGSRVLVDGAVFTSAVRGDFVPITIEGMSFPENASRSRYTGLELGVTAVAAPWLDLGAGYTFLDLRLTDYASSVLDAMGTRQLVDFSGRRMPAVPRNRIAGDVQIRPLARLSIETQVEWQGVVHVETGNADQGTWHFQAEPDGPVQHVPFRAVPARALVHMNGAVRLGPATLFGAIENLFGQRHAGNVVANEASGRFYEPGPPASASFGLRVAGWGPAPEGSR